MGSGKAVVGQAERLSAAWRLCSEVTGNEGTEPSFALSPRVIQEGEEGEGSFAGMLTDDDRLKAGEGAMPELAHDGTVLPRR